MQCQVRRSPSSVALQGQLLAGSCRVKVGTRVILRVGVMVGLCVPGVCVGCRGVESGVGVKAFVAAGMECDRMARCRGKAKSWPDRPQGSRG